MKKKVTLNELKTIIKEIINEEHLPKKIKAWRVGSLQLNPKSGGIWFGETKEGVENFAKSVRNSNEEGKEYIITLNNPKYFYNFQQDYIDEVMFKYGFNRAKFMYDLIDAGYDGMYIDKDMWNDTGDEFAVYSKQYVVFNPSQIQAV
jgi:hypothetical protein